MSINPALRTQTSKKEPLNLTSNTKSQGSNYHRLFFGSYLHEDGGHRAVYLLKDIEGHSNFSGCEIVTANRWFDPDYTALISALRFASDLGISKLMITGDAKMIIDQMNGLFSSNDPALSSLHNKISELLSNFQVLKIAWAPKWENECLNLHPNESRLPTGTLPLNPNSIPTSTEKPKRHLSTDSRNLKGLRRDGLPDRRLKCNRHEASEYSKNQTCNSIPNKESPNRQINTSYQAGVDESKNQTNNLIPNNEASFPVQKESPNPNPPSQSPSFPQDIVIDGSLSLLAELIQYSKTDWPSLPIPILQALQALDNARYNPKFGLDQAATILILGSALLSSLKYSKEKAPSTRTSTPNPLEMAYNKDELMNLLQESEHIKATNQEITNVQNQVNSLNEALSILTNNTSQSLKELSTRLDTLNILTNSLSADVISPLNLTSQSPEIQNIFEEMAKLNTTLLKQVKLLKIWRKE